MLATKQPVAPEPITEAETFVRRLPGWSQAVEVIATNGLAYAVKGVQHERAEVTGRATAAEHVVARLGHALGCPVPPLTFIDVPAELVAIEPNMAHFAAGVAHALEMIPNCSNRARITKPDSDANRDAFARLAVLFGWVVAGDPQLIYTNDALRRAYSIDHGFFLPGGPNWSAATLASEVGSQLSPFGPLSNGANELEILATVEIMKALSDEFIAATVGWVLPNWGVPDPDVVELCRFLASRRDNFPERV